MENSGKACERAPGPRARTGFREVRILARIDEREGKEKAEREKGEKREREREKPKRRW